MTVDELAKHGLRVTPLKRRNMDIVWQMNADSFHAARICAALEPIAPPDVAQAARDVIERWDTPSWKDAPATAIVIEKLRAALRVIAGETP